MWNDDDFLISFEKQVKSDIEEFLGLNPEFLKIRTYGYKGRVYDWRKLPHVSWSYQVPTKAGDGWLANYGGWMLTQSNWTDFHRQIMDELGVLADSLIEDIKKAMDKAESTWVGVLSQSFPSVLKRTHPSTLTEHSYSWMESHRKRIRQQLSTVPYVGGDSDDSRENLPPHRNGFVAGPFRIQPNSDWPDPNERQTEAQRNQSDDLPF